MSWVTYKKTAVDILTDNDYKEIAFNINAEDAPMSRMHKGFTLRPVAPDFSYAANDVLTFYKVGELIINFKVKDNSDFDKYYDDFMCIVNKVVGSNQVQTSPEYILIEDSGSFAQGKVSILLGSESSCE